MADLNTIALGNMKRMKSVRHQVTRDAYYNMFMRNRERKKVKEREIEGEREKVLSKGRVAFHRNFQLVSDHLWHLVPHEGLPHLSLKPFFVTLSPFHS